MGALDKIGDELGNELRRPAGRFYLVRGDAPARSGPAKCAGAGLCWRDGLHVRLLTLNAEPFG